MKVLYMSGDGDEVIAPHGFSKRGLSYLRKPFTLDSLAAMVRKAWGVELQGGQNSGS